VTDFDRVIDQPADLKSNTDMAVIVSSHKTTAATMNSIHSLLSENHPCTLFMASLLLATMLHRTKHIITSTVDDGALNLIRTYANAITHCTNRMLSLTVPRQAARARRRGDRIRGRGDQQWQIRVLTGMIGVAAGIVLSAFGIVLLLFRRGFGFDIATPFHWFW
jgi:hypothetical protein